MDRLQSRAAVDGAASRLEGDCALITITPPKHAAQGFALKEGGAEAGTGTAEPAQDCEVGPVGADVAQPQDRIEPGRRHRQGGRGAALAGGQQNPQAGRGVEAEGLEQF